MTPNFFEKYIPNATAEMFFLRSRRGKLGRNERADEKRNKAVGTDSKGRMRKLNGSIIQTDKRHDKGASNPGRAKNRYIHRKI